MKELCLKKKREFDEQSKVSDDIVSRVLSNNENEDIKNKLFNAIRQKQ